MNVNNVNTTGYEDKQPYSPPKNEPNSNPIKPNLKNAKINVNSVNTTDYGNKRLFALRQNKPNSNPISKVIFELLAPEVGQNLSKFTVANFVEY